MMARLRQFRFTEMQLLVVPSLMAIVGLLTIFLVQTGEKAWSWSDIWVSLAYVAFLFGMSLWLSFSGFKGDQVLFPIVAMLAGVGLLVTERLHPVFVDRGGGWTNLAQRQLLFLAIGLVLLWTMMVVVWRLDWLRRYKYTWAFGGVLLMLITLVI